MHFHCCVFHCSAFTALCQSPLCLDIPSPCATFPLLRLNVHTIAYPQRPIAQLNLCNAPTTRPTLPLPHIAALYLRRTDPRYAFALPTYAVPLLYATVRDSALAKQDLALTLRDATIPLHNTTTHCATSLSSAKPLQCSNHPPYCYVPIPRSTEPLQCSDPPTLLPICRCSALPSCTIPVALRRSAMPLRNCAPHLRTLLYLCAYLP